MNIERKKRKIQTHTGTKRKRVIMDLERVKKKDKNSLEKLYF